MALIRGAGDADFHSLLATNGERGPSVIRIRKEELDAAALAALLQGIWPSIETALSSGALVTVTERSIRVRLTTASLTVRAHLVRYRPAGD